MNGQMMKYEELLKITGKPLRTKDIKQTVKIKELFEYAKKKGVKICELTDEERNKFIVDLD